MFVSFASLESAVIDGILKVLLIIELTTDSRKLFHEASLLMMFISDGNLSVEQIRLNVSQVHKALHKFESNLRFAVDMFQNEVPLDFELSPDGIATFRT